MKKVLKYFLWTLGGLLTLVLLLIAYIALFPAPTYHEIPVKELKVEITPERVEQGMKIAKMDCYGCHLSEDNRLKGKPFVNNELGTLFTSNITQDPQFGIGAYTDGELYRLLRTGVKRDNHAALPMMPILAKMSEEDLLSLIAFLKSDHEVVQPAAVARSQSPSLITKGIMKFAVKPIPYPEEPLGTPSIEDPVAYGKYLVQGRLFCYYCHAADVSQHDLVVPENTPGYLAGGATFVEKGDTAVAPSLLINEDGLGNWTEAQFISALKWGQRPSGKPFKAPMQPYTMLDTLEVLAIWAYLKTVPEPALAAGTQ